MMEDNKLILKLDWDKETAPPPSITDVSNFVSAFQILFEEKKFSTHVEVKEGSIDLVIQCIDVGVTIACDIVLPILTSAINRPRTKKEKEASNQLSEVNTYYNCTINNIALHPQPQPKSQKFIGVEYEVIAHDLDERIKTHYDEDNNPVDKNRSEKVEAYIKIKNGDLAGQMFRIKTLSEYLDRNVTYLASFELNNEKLRITDRPMLLQ